jgi:hypothetical protein
MRWFFYKALEWIRLLCGVMPRSGFGKQKIFLFVHYFFVLLIAVLLAVFSDSITKYIWSDEPWQNTGWARDYFWGLVFINVYLIVRLVLYLVSLLGIEEGSEFPDIEEDWNQVIDALDREKLHISDLPLFIVNGLTPQQEQIIFQKAARVTWKAVAPKGSSALMRAYISDDQEKGAIFLCCTFVGATNLQQGKENSSSSWQSTEGPSEDFDGTLAAGQLSDMLAPARSPGGTSNADDMAFASDTSDPTATARPVESPRQQQQQQQSAGNDGGGLGGFLGTLVPGGLEQAMNTMQGLRVGLVETDSRKQLEPLSDVELMMGDRRMTFLCQLIAKARGTVVPINGLLQAIPYSWALADETANGKTRTLSTALHTDLAAIHQSLQLQFPVIAVTTELDEVAGIQEFLTRLDKDKAGLRHSRAGHRFAPGADVDLRNAKWLVNGAMQWFRGWVYAAFARDLDNANNRNLFQMLCEVSQRQKSLTSLLWRSLSEVSTPPLRLYGSYFVASGKSTQRQGFVQGVLSKMVDVQGEVAYTPQARKQQQRNQIVGWTLFLLAAVLGVASVVLFVQTSGKAD